MFEGDPGLRFPSEAGDTREPLSPYVRRMHGEITLEEFIAAEEQRIAASEHTIFQAGSFIITEDQVSGITVRIRERFVPIKSTIDRVRNSINQNNDFSKVDGNQVVE